ncbi:hypothetical protein SNEBB_009655 [Seison nebaliae]|nr:hypothetical protein SNEBB_009655 [Seison nebaliae]
MFHKELYDALEIHKNFFENNTLKDLASDPEELVQSIFSVIPPESLANIIPKSLLKEKSEDLEANCLKELKQLSTETIYDLLKCVENNQNNHSENVAGTGGGGFVFPKAFLEIKALNVNVSDASSNGILGKINENEKFLKEECEQLKEEEDRLIEEVKELKENEFQLKLSFLTTIKEIFESLKKRKWINQIYGSWLLYDEEKINEFYDDLMNDKIVMNELDIDRFIRDKRVEVKKVNEKKIEENEEIQSIQQEERPLLNRKRKTKYVDFDTMENQFQMIDFNQPQMNMDLGIEENIEIFPYSVEDSFSPPQIFDYKIDEQFLEQFEEMMIRCSDENEELLANEKRRRLMNLKNEELNDDYIVQQIIQLDDEADEANVIVDDCINRLLDANEDNFNKLSIDSDVSEQLELVRKDLLQQFSTDQEMVNELLKLLGENLNFDRTVLK